MQRLDHLSMYHLSMYADDFLTRTYIYNDIWCICTHVIKFMYKYHIYIHIQIQAQHSDSHLSIYVDDFLSRTYICNHL